MEEEHDETGDAMTEAAHDEANAENILEKVRIALAAKGISLTCPRCGGQRWDFRGYTVINISHDPQSFDFAGGRRAVSLCCSQCGFYSAHDAEVLGLVL